MFHVVRLINDEETILCTCASHGEAFKAMLRFDAEIRATENVTPMIIIDVF